ncbi:MAG: FHA domain-containing protein [Deltaproteobacteria bacterium]|nr:FHA domain-containing protein [Deltaproteobacteria bacterium]
MAVDQQLLEILACIQCRGPLVAVEGGRGLLCEACKLKFPVRDDIPVLLLEEVLDMQSGARGATSVAAATDLHVPTVTFRVTAGPKKGMTIQLERGTCKAVGRTVGDPHKTTSYHHIDVTLSLDENTRKLIQQYVAKQFRRADNGPGKEFGFRRTGDIVLDDVSVSRLHAMFFYDDIGVGILDLVSKNGTYVNGEEVESRLLRKGDVIELGESKIVLEE